ncbi:hypothetical protein LCGC14_1855400 [marine sediment metagenome]|uniref:Uncharacterized protein n=1 Tax=marine sediment metagenome TaxID=412755 RepID=A0A0F9GXH1_9ZZZZ
MIFIILPNIIFVILIGISTAYLTFLTTKGGLTNNKFKGVWKRLTIRGKYVFFTLLSFLLILIGQELNTKALSNQKDLLLKKERLERDYTITAGIKKGVESTSKDLFEALSKAFAQQELSLDTLKNNIIVLKDSVKNTVNYYNEADPVLIIDENGVFKEENHELLNNYKIRFNSYDAGSTNFNINCLVLLNFEDESLSVARINFFPKNLRLYRQSSWISGFKFDNSKTAKSIYFLLIGRYSTIDGAKWFKINDLYMFDSYKEEVSLITNSEKSRIVKLIELAPDSKLTEIE